MLTWMEPHKAKVVSATCPDCPVIATLHGTSIERQTTMRSDRCAIWSGRGIRLTALALTMSAAASIVVSCSSSTATPVDTSSQSVDGMIDVGGDRSLYAKCQGLGSPTVVLIAGKGNGAQDWQDVLAPGDPVHQHPGDDVPLGVGTLEPSDGAVFPSVAQFTRVCTYDRPDIRSGGVNVTTPRPQPHSVDLDVTDLHALLT